MDVVGFAYFSKTMLFELELPLKAIHLVQLHTQGELVDKDNHPFLP
jgi:hypothetical protein